MIIQCTTCLAKFKFDEKKFGNEKNKKVKCTKCGSVFSVLAPDLRQAPAGRTARHAAGKALPEPKARISTLELDSDDAKPQVNYFATSEFKAMFEAPVGSEGEEVPAPESKEAAVAAPAGSGEEEPPPFFDSLIDDETGKEEVTGSMANVLTDNYTSQLQSPAGYSGESDEAQVSKMSVTTIDPTALERPSMDEQEKINAELYESEQKGLKKIPKLEALTEIDFDINKDDILELDDGRSSVYGMTSRTALINEMKRLAVRPLTGNRAKNFIPPRDFPGLFFLVIKIALISLILLVVLIGGKMLLEKDGFNYTKLDLRDLSHIVKKAPSLVREGRKPE